MEMDCDSDAQPARLERPEVEMKGKSEGAVANIGIFYDFENVLQGVMRQSSRYVHSLARDTEQIVADIRERLRKVCDGGSSTIWAHRAYANWESFGQAGPVHEGSGGTAANPALNQAFRDLKAALLPIMELKGYMEHYNVKNNADLVMATDVLDIVYRRLIEKQKNPDAENVWVYTHIVLVTGDAGFYSLAAKLRALDIYVMGAGFALHTNIDYARICNEFLFLPERGSSVALQMLRRNAKRVLKGDDLADVMKKIQTLSRPPPNMTLDDALALMREVKNYSDDSNFIRTLERIEREEKKSPPKSKLERLLHDMERAGVPERGFSTTREHAFRQIRNALHFMTSWSGLDDEWMDTGVSIALVWRAIFASISRNSVARDWIENNCLDDHLDVLRFLCTGTRVCLYSSEGNRFAHLSGSHSTNSIVVGLRKQPPKPPSWANGLKPVRFKPLPDQANLLAPEPQWGEEDDVKIEQEQPLQGLAPQKRSREEGHENEEAMVIEDLNEQSEQRSPTRGPAFDYQLAGAVRTQTSKVQKPADALDGADSFSSEYTQESEDQAFGSDEGSLTLRRPGRASSESSESDSEHSRNSLM
ncbi:hypothetical protein FVE85_6722 [Porphyridium purpureum]|uniref:NYN domain-containing protein n=1 Tax=Porphyridium purpureum TaxID=35688 RepID=A0A5J4Z8Z8_PORPP|nr:hypothetical protein FVE85_6722 [Porphyridium purpureum]|eukprot:POR4918..scf295_1